MSLAFHSGFSSPPYPFFSGTGSSTLVPTKMHVAIGGYAFMIDTTKYTRQTLPRQRENQNQSGEPGEESLNPLGYWRRSAQRFDLGAGQSYFDDSLPDITSSRRRFYASKGLDVFSDPHSVSLLPDTAALSASPLTDTNLTLLATDTYLYLLSGDDLLFFDPTAITGSQKFFVDTFTRSNGDLTAHPIADTGQTWRMPLDFSSPNSVKAVIDINQLKTSGEIATYPLMEFGEIPYGMEATVTFSSATSGDNAIGLLCGVDGTTASTLIDNCIHAAFTPDGYEVKLIIGAAFVSIPDAAGAWSSPLTKDGTTEHTFAWTLDGDILTVIPPSGSGDDPITITDSRFSTLIGTYGIYEIFLPDDTHTEPRFSEVSAATIASVTFSSESLSADGSSICTDGTNIYIAEPGGKLQKSEIGHTGGAADFDPDSYNPELIAFTNGRLIAALDNTVFELAGDGSQVGSGIWTYLYGTASNVTVTSVAGTPQGIFFSATIGNRSEIYFTTADDTSGDLAPATYAGCMPVGEFVNTMAYYGTVLVLGTSRGVRVALISGSQTAATLEIQPLVDLGVSVTSLEPQAQFVFFGWSNFDSSSTGLGRMDLSKSTGNTTPYTSILIPAYASDLMAANRGAVTSIASFANRRYFTVLGDDGNLYRESSTAKVASGTMDSGWVRMGSLIYKQYAGVEVTHDPLNGTVAVSVEGPDGDSRSLGISSDTGALDSNLFDTQLRARAAKLHLTLTRSDNSLIGPVIRSWTLDALPSSPTVDEINVPLLFNSEVVDLRGERKRVDPLDAFDYLQSLCHDGTIVAYQEGENVEQVQVSQVIMDTQEDRKWTQPEAFKGIRRKWLTGTVYVKLTTREV